MAHRTLNSVTALYGDMRERPHNRRMSSKMALACDLWPQVFPGERMPYRIRDAYAALESAGYAWRPNTSCNGRGWQRAGESV